MTKPGPERRSASSTVTTAAIFQVGASSDTANSWRFLVEDELRADVLTLVSSGVCVAFHEVDCHDGAVTASVVVDLAAWFRYARQGVVSLRWIRGRGARRRACARVVIAVALSPLCPTRNADAHPRAGDGLGVSAISREVGPLLSRNPACSNHCPKATDPQHANLTSPLCPVELRRHHQLACRLRTAHRTGRTSRCCVSSYGRQVSSYS